MAYSTLSVPVPDLCFHCHYVHPHVLGHAAQHACYMPTLSLANTVSYNALEDINGFGERLPPIRVWER